MQNHTIDNKQRRIEITIEDLAERVDDHQWCVLDDGCH